MVTRSSVVLLLAALALLPAPAAADNTSCANAHFLFMGVARGVGVSNAAPRYFKARVVAGRSYSFYTWAPFQDAGDGEANVQHTLFADSTCTTLATTVVTSVREPSVEVDGHIGGSHTIIPTFTGTLYIKVQAFGPGFVTAFTAMHETTLFSPWWYAAGDYNAFAEIKNATNTTLTYALTAYRSNGTVCGSTAANLPAGGNIGINIRNLGTCQAAGSGSAQIAFQGPPGAIVANITTLDGALGLSFDAPFTARMPWALTTQ